MPAGSPTTGGRNKRREGARRSRCIVGTTRAGGWRRLGRTAATAALKRRAIPSWRSPVPANDFEELSPAFVDDPLRFYPATAARRRRLYYPLLPLDRARRLAGVVVDDAVDAGDFVDDPSRDSATKRAASNG